MLDKFFLQNDILGSAMQASALRNEVIASNIANQDTPGYKKKVVNFEKYLDDELRRSGNIKNIDFKRLNPTVTTIHSNFQYRIDGNNVDPAAEAIEEYKNAAKYDVLVSGINSNYKRINMAIIGIK